MIRQRLKVVAIAGVVVLALTGFSRHGHASGSHGHGGGCSGPSRSSSSGSGSGSSSGGAGSATSDTGAYDPGAAADASPTRRSANPSHRTPGPTRTSSGKTRKTVTATVEVVRCAGAPQDGREPVRASTLRVTAGRGFSGTVWFRVTVMFLGADGQVVDTAEREVSLHEGQKATTSVPMTAPDAVARVARCTASVAAE